MLSSLPTSQGLGQSGAPGQAGPVGRAPVTGRERGVSAASRGGVLSQPGQEADGEFGVCTAGGLARFCH